MPTVTCADLAMDACLHLTYSRPQPCCLKAPGETHVLPGALTGAVCSEANATWIVVLAPLKEHQAPAVHVKLNCPAERNTTEVTRNPMPADPPLLHDACGVVGELPCGCHNSCK